MTPELKNAIARLVAAQRQLVRRGREWVADIADQASVRLLDEAIAELQSAEHAVLTESMAAYHRETES